MVSFKRIAAAIAAFGLASGIVSAASAADLFNNTNIYGVANNAMQSPTFTVNGTARINQLVTYHWNNGQGAQPGSIALRTQNGQIIGPFAAHGTAGQGNAQNVNWIADVSLSLAPGTYTVVDSNPYTWSQNYQSGGRGFAIVRGDIVAPAPAPTSYSYPAPAPRPVFTPAPAPAPVATPNCGYPGGVARSFPCSGQRGATITITLQRALQRPLALIQFKPVQVSLAGATGANILSQFSSGGGTAAGSTYTLPAPAALCITRGGTWQLNAVDTAGQALGAIGGWATVNCP